MFTRIAHQNRSRRGIACVAIVATCFACGCNRPSAAPSTAIAPPKVAKKPAPPPSDVPVATPQTPRGWLYATRYEHGRTGGYVNGSFDARHNTLSIEAYAVTEFVLDTSYIAINWDKLVVLRINGHGSELKVRDNPVLHFTLDSNRKWVIDE